MKRHIATILVIGLTFFIWAAAAAADDAAMVVDLMGGEATYKSGDRAGQNVMLMDFLVEGEKIELGEGVTLVLNYFASGAREEIKGPGVVVVGEAGSKKEGDVAVKSTKVEFVPPKSQVAGADTQHTGAVALRDVQGADKIRILGMEETAVRKGPVELEWRPVKTAEKYKVAVRDVLDEKVLELETENTRASVPADKLRAGDEYVWRIKAYLGDKVVGKAEGRFFVLAPDDLSSLKHTEKYIDKTYDQDSDEEKIALAMLYKKYRLNNEARRILLDLRRRYPRNTNIMRQIMELRDNYPH